MVNRQWRYRDHAEPAATLIYLPNAF